MVDLEGVKEYFSTRNLMMVGAAGVAFFAGQMLYNAIATRFGGEDEAKAVIFGIIGSMLAAAIVYAWGRSIPDIESPWKPVLYGAAIGLALPAVVNGLGLLFRATGLSSKVSGVIGAKVSTVAQYNPEVVVVKAPQATSTGGGTVSSYVIGGE